MTTDLLWTEASVDIEAEQQALRMSRAKVAVAGLWPFLALAKTAREFEHRLALTADSLAERVETDLIAPVVASLREDFSLVVTAQDDQDDDSDDDDDKPDWLKEKIKSSSSRHLAEYYDEGRAAWVKVAAEDDPDGLDANSGKGNPWYFTGGPEAGPATGETNQYPTFPAGPDPVDPINQMFPMQPQPWQVPPGGEWRENPMQFNPPRQGSRGRRPFTTAAEHGDRSTCQECGGELKFVRHRDGAGWYHEGKQSWLTDDSHPGVPRTQKRAITQYHDEGVQSGSWGERNPYYFDEGDEGVAGQQSGFPTDVSLPEPDEAVDSYGQQRSGMAFFHEGTQRWISLTAASDTEENSAPDSDPNLGTDFDSSQEATRYRKARDGEPPGSHDSTTFLGSRRTVAEHAPYRIESGDGGYYVVNEDGTRKNSKPKSHSEARQFQKALYANVPGARESAEEDEERKHGARFFDPSDPYVRMVAADGGDGNLYGGQQNPYSADPGGGDDPGGVPAPPSMTPGQPGSQPQPAPAAAGGGVPTTTGPRQMPGGGGPGNVNSPTPTDPTQTRAASWHVGEGQNRARPTLDNPYGTADPFDAKTWENSTTQRPRQRLEEMNPNGPQNPSAREPIRTVHSPGPGPQQDEDDDEDDD